MSEIKLPRLAITMGDPAGVGPEVCLRMLNDPEVRNEFVPTIFGDACVLRAVAQQIGVNANAPIVDLDRWLAGEFPTGSPLVVDHGIIELCEFHPGKINAATGYAGYSYVDSAIDAALAGAVDAVTTAPLNKEAMSLAGIKFPGHTEIFAARTTSSRWCMMQYSPEITCTFVTVHVGYHQVPQLLSKERILEVIELTHEGLQLIRGRQPKIIVCGLNPHAGEHGLFGNREEERFIVPAIDAARAAGIDVDGPLPPDTAFLPTRRAQTDAFVCMYHDQGHIPVKALAFDSAVNTTLGLPIIRTSVDHGTALDIAWQGKANPSSLYCAARLAVKLVHKERSSTIAVANEVGMVNI